MSGNKTNEVERLSLGRLCKLLKNYAINEEFKFQRKILNHIIDIVFSDFIISEQRNFDKKIIDEIPYYETGNRYLSEIFNEKTEIKSEIKKVLVDRECDCKRISKVLQGKTEIKHLGKKINYMEFFNYEKVSAYCFVLLQQVDSLPKAEIENVTSTYKTHRPEFFADFLAQIIYLVVKRIKNVPSNTFEENETISYLPLVDRIKYYFENGYYHNNYQIKFQIEPIKKLGVFKIWSKEIKVIENLKDNSDKTAKMYYQKNELSSANRIKDRKILEYKVNGIDYKDLIISSMNNIQFKKERKDFKYYYECTIDDIPESEEYCFEIETKRQCSLPFYRYNSSLKLPSKQFHLSVELIGEEKNDWRLYVVFKSPFHMDLKSESSYIRHPFDHAVSIDLIGEWLLKGSGFTIFIIPKTEKWNDWQE